MEEDMYRLNECLSDRGIAEKLIERAKDTNIIYRTNDTVLNTKAVQRLAKYIERLQKENKELKDKYIHEKVAKEEVEELLEDSIPKSKVKENLKQLEKEYKQDLESNSIKAFILKCKIEAIKELLGEE